MTFVRLAGAELIQNAIDDPDFMYNGEEEPTELLLKYLEETGCKIPKNWVNRKDVTKLMIRYWTTREALGLIADMYDSRK